MQSGQSPLFARRVSEDGHLLQKYDLLQHLISISLIALGDKSFCDDQLLAFLGYSRGSASFFPSFYLLFLLLHLLDLPSYVLSPRMPKAGCSKQAQTPSLRGPEERERGHYARGRDGGGAEAKVSTPSVQAGLG